MKFNDELREKIQITCILLAILLTVGLLLVGLFGMLFRMDFLPDPKPGETWAQHDPYLERLNSNPFTDHQPTNMVEVLAVSNGWVKYYDPRFKSHRSDPVNSFRICYYKPK